MRPRRLFAALLLTTCASLGAGSALAQDAPFGLVWGPVAEVPRPSVAFRDHNITVLVYLPDRAPAGIADTGEIVLKVCAPEGLQRVIWVSRRLPAAEAEARYAAALAEGTRRYGPPEIDPRSGEVVWQGGRAGMSWSREEGSARQFTMTAHGPGFSACSGHHQDVAGHPATEHRYEALLRH